MDPTRHQAQPDPLKQPAVLRWLSRVARAMSLGLVSPTDDAPAPAAPSGNDWTRTRTRKYRAHRAVRNAMAKASRRRNRAA